MNLYDCYDTIQRAIQNSFCAILFELNRSMAKESHCRNLYDFHWAEKIHALGKA